MPRKRPDHAHDIDLSAAVLRLQARCAGAECERDALRDAVRRIQAACGMPDPADGCREVLRIAREVMADA